VDGRAALARWHASRPDGVLLDLALPGRDGLVVLAGLGFWCELKGSRRIKVQ
jgi:CheY-like chemotaxis protein